MEVPLDELRVTEPMERIRFFGDVRGTFYIDELRMVTQATAPSTAVAGQPEPQGDFRLGQNYPNPFNSRTVIGFRLAAAGPVRLAVHDVTGQRIRTLIDGGRAAGHHVAIWDGDDGSGHPVASGVYLYRLRVGVGQVASRKLLLIR
jgi:hypothetical protein